MKKIIGILIVLMIAAIGLTACTSTEIILESEKTGQQKQQQQNGSEQEPSKSWDKSLEDTIVIEGMKEAITLKLFEAGSKFITYFPENFVTESASSGEGDTYWFYANYGGNKNENVYLQLSLFPESITEKPEMIGEKGRLMLQGFNMQLVKDADKIHTWSLEEYRSVKGDNVVYGMLGKHEGQYFAMVIHYPVEYGDGFEPRVNIIINKLYWTDSNESLVK